MGNKQHFTYVINDGLCDPSIRIDESGAPFFWVGSEDGSAHQLIDTLQEAIRVSKDPNYTPTEGNTDKRPA
jgi:hypothetical protein